LKTSFRQPGSAAFSILPSLFLFFATIVSARADNCAVCGNRISGTIYLATDRVTVERKSICTGCTFLVDACFVCSLPVKFNGVELSDGRILCARDARRAVLDLDEAKRIAAQVRDDLDRLFSRFISFPSNTELTVVNRLDLLKFKIPGNDFECPNILGYVTARTNRNERRYSIRLMGALTVTELKATAAHEYGHTWVLENVSPERLATLGKDAHEGFCELVAYLLMDSQREEEQKKAIRRNGYTRGQLDVFLQAENR
jgi:hypothetical protein